MPSFRGRVLVCAPSNAAIDEIVGRLVRSRCVPDVAGRLGTPAVVRLGVSASGDPKVQAVTLQAQVTKLLQPKPDALAQGRVAKADLDRLDRLRRKQEDLNKVIAKVVADISNPVTARHTRVTLEQQLESLQVDRDKLFDAVFDATPVELRSASAANPIAARQQIMRRANVVCTTLSASMLVPAGVKFDVRGWEGGVVPMCRCPTCVTTLPPPHTHPLSPSFLRAVPGHTD